MFYFSYQKVFFFFMFSVLTITQLQTLAAFLLKFFAQVCFADIFYHHRKLSWGIVPLKDPYVSVFLKKVIEIQQILPCYIRFIALQNGYLGEMCLKCQCHMASFTLNRESPNLIHQYIHTIRSSDLIICRWIFSEQTMVTTAPPWLHKYLHQTEVSALGSEAESLYCSYKEEEPSEHNKWAVLNKHLRTDTQTQSHFTCDTKFSFSFLAWSSSVTAVCHKAEPLLLEDNLDGQIILLYTYERQFWQKL